MSDVEPRSAGWPLGPRSARILYNVADARWPAPDVASGAPDAVAALAGALADARARRRVERTLWWIEWSPRLALRSRRGFSWLARDARRAWLERLERRAPGALRDRVRELLAWIGQSPPPGA
jgi:hypothetical protein